MIVRDVEEDCLIICNEVTFIAVLYICANDHYLVDFFCQENWRSGYPYAVFSFASNPF